MGHTVRTLHTRATSGASGLWQTYRHWRYAILFYSLLLTFVVGPLDSALGLRTNLLELFLAINRARREVLKAVEAQAAS